MTYPRRPTEEEKEQIAETIFPDKKVDEIDFSDVWMLTGFIEAPDFNCFAWSILAIATISIPDKLSTMLYLCERAKEKYGAPFDYVKTNLASSDAVIIAWGKDQDDIMHASRYVTKSLLKEYQNEFRLTLNFDSPDAKGFPNEIWSSKLGDGVALLTHPKNWLEGAVWGTKQGVLKIKEEQSEQ